MYVMGIKILGLPYQSFKEKIHLVKKYTKRYDIEVFQTNNTSGILYMERKGTKYE